MAYERVNWENLPSTKTPINQTNLNKMENELVTLDTQTTITSISNAALSSSYTIEDNNCFKFQNYVNIGINIYNSSSTYSTYSWVQLARLPEGSRPSGERYISGFGCAAAWGTPTTVPILINAAGYISVFLRTEGLKRVIANGIIRL